MKVRYEVNGTLACPMCGSMNLHHEDVEVFNRHGDIQESPTVATKVVAGWDGAIVSQVAGDKNPSKRRDGISIWFWCEHHAEDRMELTLSQHKGSTYLEWRGCNHE